MNNRPIIFSAPMVCALLEGRKTPTRRILKPQPYECDGRWWIVDRHSGDCYLDMWARGDVGCRPFLPGDRLWVRENLAVVANWDHIFYAATGCDHDKIAIEDEHAASIHQRYGDHYNAQDEKRVPSIHMPRWASRLTLIVTDVKAVRLQDISEEDARAEGCFVGKATGRIFENATSMRLGGNEWASARDWFADLWESINGPDAWDANPWVIAISFAVQHANIDQIPEANAI